MTSAAEARERIGLSLDAAARQARINPRYLRRVELHGAESYLLALRLSHIYAAPIDLFLPKGNRTPDNLARAGAATGKGTRSKQRDTR